MRHALIILGAAVMAANPVFAADSHTGHDHKSPYAGQQTRDIKALSGKDLEELLRGGGWGLAKAAELNGMPGPAHVLDMANDLHLSAEQLESVAKVRDEMREKAVALGERFVSKEGELEARFRSGDFPQAELALRVKEIETLRAELRIVHLSAHLKVARILTKDQVERYASLRGYR